MCICVSSNVLVMCDCVSVVLGQDDFTVSYTHQSVCVLRGSSVDLPCSYTQPSGQTVRKTFWFTKQQPGSDPVDLSLDPEYAGRVEYRGDKERDCTLRITDLRESDAAEYQFGFMTDQPGGRYSGKPGITLSVTGTVTLWSSYYNRETVCVCLCLSIRHNKSGHACHCDIISHWDITETDTQTWPHRPNQSLLV